MILYHIRRINDHYYYYYYCYFLERCTFNLVNPSSFSSSFSFSPFFLSGVEEERRYLHVA